MIAPPRFLERVFYGNTLLAWLTALGVLVGVWLALVVVRRLVVRRLEKVAPRTATNIDDLALGAARRTSTVFLLVVALDLATHTSLNLPPLLETFIERFSAVVLLVQAARWGLGAIAFWLAHLTRHRAQHDRASLTTINFLGIAARFVLFVLLLLLALDAFGVNITGLVTGLGIAGVAVALAVQNILGDLFASLSIALDKPFVIGDSIAVDNFNGTVEDIGLKTTRLRALGGETLVFSNADLLKSRIRNFRGQAERRITFTLLLAPDTPPDKVERVPPTVKEIVTAEQKVRFDRSHFSAITPDGALVVETVYFVTTGDYNTYMDLQQRVYLALLRRLAADGVSLVRPTPPVVLSAERGAQSAEGPPT
jgi:small-conductance mechanosensitive channel